MREMIGTVGMKGIKKRYLAVSILFFAVFVAAMPAFSFSPVPAARVLAEPPPAEEPEEEGTPEEQCEDKVLFGGIICGIVGGMAGLIQGLYQGVIAYANFGLYQPVTGDEVGKSGVNAETYSKLKSTWQIFARMASLLVVAAFLIMIISSSVAGRS